MMQLDFVCLFGKRESRTRPCHGPILLRGEQQQQDGIKTSFAEAQNLLPCPNPNLIYRFCHFGGQSSRPSVNRLYQDMSSLEVARAELGLVVLYLNKAEARDKICRTIQYGSRFLSDGKPGTAQDVEKSTSLARKVFRLFKFVNDLHALISPTPRGTPLPLVLLGKSKNALLSTFLFLDQIIWLSRSGIYKNKERAELLGRISLFCWLGSSICSVLGEVGELGRLSASMKKLEKDLRNGNKYKDEKYMEKLKTSNERSLALIKAAMDIVVAVGLLQLAPKKVTPRISGAFGFVSSLISCYQLLPSPAKPKAT